MADLLITYAITALMFVILGGVVFGARSRRYNQLKNSGPAPNS